TKANIFYLQNDFENAINILEAALRIDPNFSLAIEMITASLIQLKDEQKLNSFLKDQKNKVEHPEKCKALFKLIHNNNGTELDLRKINIYKKPANSSLIAWDLYLHVHLGNYNLALDILEAGVKKRKGQFINFAHDPFLKPLHTQERFIALVENTSSRVLLSEEEDQKAKTSTRSKAGLSDKESDYFLKEMNQLLKEEKLYLNPELSLKDLSNQLDIHPNKLSWLINEKMGKNFNEYINRFRLETFKEKAIDPSNSHLTLLGLAYESGFNSKSVFNAFFKKMEGVTPGAWVKSHK
ncbi:MAG TPA: helix-turn-helix domain-containing protein, partial [Saprospiraceae bacterium]|nr:helix-turn-helix domain-containing protein [Saprospiraceae bacterium]